MSIKKTGKDSCPYLIFYKSSNTKGDRTKLDSEWALRFETQSCLRAPSFCIQFVNCINVVRH